MKKSSGDNGAHTFGPAEERWADIPGYEGWYQASNLGRIRRVAPGPNTWPGHVLKPKRERDGYLRVNLCRGGERRIHRVHRLAWAAFNGPIPDGLEINHIDHDKAHNVLENLELVTSSGNKQAALAHYGGPWSPRGEANGRARLTDDAVRAIRRRYAAGGVTQRALAREFGVDKSLIGHIVRREIWQHVTDDPTDAADIIACAAPRPRTRILIADRRAA